MAAEAPPQNPNAPTLHHLNDSQSQRILWLLEELSIEYNLVLYERDKKQHRAPPSLASVQPLGKSPVLVTSSTEGSRVISESSAIAAYLIKTYDTSGQFAAVDWVHDEQLTSFAGASLGPTSAIELLFDLAAKHTPFPFGFIMRGIRKKMQDFYTMPEFRRGLGWLETEMGEEEWFNGKCLGRADVMLSWPLDTIVQRGWMDVKGEFPRIGAWRERILQRPAWKRAIEKGNGYDLSSW